MAAKNGKVAVAEVEEEEEEEAPAPPKKKSKKLDYLGGSENFNSEHNVAVATARMTAWLTANEEWMASDEAKELVNVLKGIRDHCGWKVAGRLFITGKAARG